MSSESDSAARTCVPADYFVYAGEGETEGSSLYRCLNCPTGLQGRKISAGNKSRYNLKKHMTVCLFPHSDDVMFVIVNCDAASQLM